MHHASLAGGVLVFTYTVGKNLGSNRNAQVGRHPLDVIPLSMKSAGYTLTMSIYLGALQIKCMRIRGPEQQQPCRLSHWCVAARPFEARWENAGRSLDRLASHQNDQKPISLSTMEHDKVCVMHTLEQKHGPTETTGSPFVFCAVGYLIISSIYLLTTLAAGSIGGGEIRHN